MALRGLRVLGFRGIRQAELSLDATTVLIGENDCGKSSLLEALALVLSPLDDGRPVVQPWQFHRAPGARPEPVRIELELAETRAGSWDRPELAPLVPVLGERRDEPRRLVVLLTARPEAERPAAAHWELRGPGGRGSRDDAAALAAVRRMNPLLWLRRGVLVKRSPDAGPAGAPPTPSAAPSDAADVLRSYERFQSGTAASEEHVIESGFAAAQRLLAQWAPQAVKRRPGARAAVAEIVGRALDAAPGASARPRPGGSAQKLGTFLLTARLFEHLRGAAPGVRPIIAVEEPEAGLHPMTLASVWGLLERLDVQKIVATHSGTLLSAAPLRSLRRLVRGADGVVREWRVGEGVLRREELRKVGYHLRARRGVACFARCWLLVEGETEYWLLPELARLLGHDLVQEGIACVEFAQSGLAPLLKVAQALGIEWHVLTDGDRAGEAYAAAARSLLRGADASLRVSRLAENDVEHCFWRYGYARVFERLAGVRARSGLTPRRVIGKAIDRSSKPGVAFELLAAVAAPGSPGAPPPLRRAIETSVALARNSTAPASG